MHVVRHAYQDRELEKMRNRIPLARLLHENAHAYRVSYSKVLFLILYNYKNKLQKIITVMINNTL